MSPRIAIIIGTLLLGLGALIVHGLQPRFKSGDAITIKQCTRGYWYQVDHGKYKSDEFSCTHYHVTLTRVP